jgi:hypothetical protein
MFVNQRWLQSLGRHSSQKHGFGRSWKWESAHGQSWPSLPRTPSPPGIWLRPAASFDISRNPIFILRTMVCPFFFKYPPPGNPAVCPAETPRASQPMTKRIPNKTTRSRGRPAGSPRALSAVGAPSKVGKEKNTAVQMGVSCLVRGAPSWTRDWVQCGSALHLRLIFELFFSC